MNFKLLTETWNVHNSFKDLISDLAWISFIMFFPY